MNKSDQYDVLVVGGGHAGTEAALASARMGAKTLLLTQSIDSLGQMSCNPAIGGIGKGHLVKEIDAMGGVMARAADSSGIQFRILNTRKGPAVRATRAQIDRALYRVEIQIALNSQNNLYLFQQSAHDLIIVGDQVKGVVTQVGLKFFAPSVILAAGTFLRGQIHIGQHQYQGGRAGEHATIQLADRLRELLPSTGRLKTGTPPRIDARTVDYRRCKAQAGDSPTPVFSFLGSAKEHPRQVVCHITHTNEKTHAIIRKSLHQSPMYNGNIDGLGPRYCPSVEDKVVRFSDKPSHQIFIEPEGLNSQEIYPNGISTSLPVPVQQELVHSICGFEQARITRSGYAIEYDFFDPRGLHLWLETKVLGGLFFAGQINGTTGYEEAAAQGLLAGINAALRAQDKAPWYPGRHEAYLGVMIDDLVTYGTLEPYRMFTSRAEHRLLLREDNADLRLTEVAHQLGLIDVYRWSKFSDKSMMLSTARTELANMKISPNSKLADHLGLSLNQGESLLHLLGRPEITIEKILTLPDIGERFNRVIFEQLQTQIRYKGYIERQEMEIARLQGQEHTQLPTDINYQQIHGLSKEAEQKLSAQRPDTLGQAARIPGITSATISLLMVFLKKSA